MRRLRPVAGRRQGTGERESRRSFVAAGLRPEWNTVKHVEPGGDDQPRHLGAKAFEDVTSQAGAIVETASKRSRPGLGGQQLTQEIAMTLLEVDELIAASGQA